MQQPQDDLRVPPHDAAAERAVLGVVLRDNDAFDEAAALLRGDEDFHVFANRLVWRAIAELRTKGSSADVVTVFRVIEDRKQSSDVDAKYLSGLWDQGPSAASLPHYADIVRGKAVAREIIRTCRELETEAMGGAAADQLIELAERRVFEISVTGQRSQAVPQEKAVAEYLDELERRRTSKDLRESGVIVTGWPDLDDIMIGLHPQEFCIVGARPAVGKSVFAVSMAKNAAGQGFTVLFVALEQSRHEQVYRQICARSGVGSWKVRRGMLNPLETQSVSQAAHAISPLPIWYDDTPAQSLSRITSTARRLRAREKLGLVIVDYLQLMGGVDGKNAGKRYEEIGRVSRGLKLLARELNIPVMALAQLNRASEDRGDRRPRMADLRESGNLEQDADTILLLHKPDAPDKDRPVDVMQVLVEKSRNGPTGEIRLMHRKATFELLCEAEL